MTDLTLRQMRDIILRSLEETGRQFTPAKAMRAKKPTPDVQKKAAEPQGDHNGKENRVDRSR